MDVNAKAVATLLRAHAFPLLIHGHTHRPADHRVEVDGHACARIVLADWREESGAGTGEVLAWDGESLSRQTLK